MYSANQGTSNFWSSADLILSDEAAWSILDPLIIHESIIERTRIYDVQQANNGLYIKAILFSFWSPKQDTHLYPQLYEAASWDEYPLRDHPTWIY